MKRQVRELGSLALPSMDISTALRGWEFQSGQVNVRLIRGDDGKPKIQLRLDLGLLQMELTGRPDGKRPHRYATELDYHRRRLQQHIGKTGTEDGFKLSKEDAGALRDECAMYYHRYLSLFVLEQFQNVLKDTQHNLDALEMCRKFGATEYDRVALEQHRPYILMMHTRARACEALRQGFPQTAIAYLRGGVKQIARLFPRPQRKYFVRQSPEARMLVDMLQQIRQQLPPDPRLVLARRLKEAVAAERYEEAATLRDQLGALVTGAPMATKRRRKKRA